MGECRSEFSESMGEFGFCAEKMSNAEQSSFPAARAMTEPGGEMQIAKTGVWISEGGMNARAGPDHREFSGHR